ncbi:MAG: radical SAM protein [Candidatus Omnitrophota bacterium]|nr:radical SAM protein [Candidatus Omnitrophota bacterium]
MKVLFIFKSENFLAPIGLCAISAMAIKKGHKTYLCEINSQNPLKCIADLKPDVVAYSSSTGEAKHYLRLNLIIKQKFPHIFTVMGGPHSTFYPEVIYEEGLDAVCVGEGEDAFIDLLGALSNKQSLENIPNIVIKDNKDKFNVRHLVEDLDILPFPDYALIYDNTPIGKYPLKNIITSRGCPYDCTYCFNSAWRKIYTGRGKSVRRHSVDYVIDEIRCVKDRWALSCVKFYDDIFTYSADNWLEEFSQKYKKYINLPFFILTRADLLTEDMVKLLRNAGCRTISMSIEAGNADIRNKVLRRNMSNKQIVDAHRLCDKYGIYTFTNCILGLPGTTIDNDIESIDLAIRAKVTWAEFPIFYPYPKTELGQYAVKMGLYKPDYEKMHTSYQYRSLLNCFTEKQKNAQMNLSVLGAVAIALPRFRSLIVRYLIYIQHNPFFTLVYYLTKMYVLRKKIYVTRTAFWESIRIFVRSLKQEWFRHEDQRG